MNYNMDIEPCSCGKGYGRDAKWTGSKWVCFYCKKQLDARKQIKAMFSDPDFKPYTGDCRYKSFG